jgi:hypothetical protein
VAMPEARWRFVETEAEANVPFGIGVRRGALAMTRFTADLGFGLDDDLAAHLIAYRDWLGDHPY